MSTLKKLIHSNIGYFEDLNQSTKDIVTKAILKAADDRNGPEGYKSDVDCLESIECRPRDGFSPFGHNRGGLTYRNFTNLMEYFGGGYNVAHKGAANEIQRQIDYSFELVGEQFQNEISEHDFEYYFSKDTSKLTYEHIQGIIYVLKKGDCNYGFKGENVDKLQTWIEQIQNLENEFLNDDQSSIMHELRFMYRGKENGVHSASISAAVNIEGPYHRSSIPWASGVFCEGSKEVEITWRNNAELKRKLDRALTQVSKAIF